MKQLASLLMLLLRPQIPLPRWQQSFHNHKLNTIMFHWSSAYLLESGSLLEHHQPRYTLPCIPKCLQVFKTNSVKDLHLLGLMIRLWSGERLRSGLGYETSAATFLTGYLQHQTIAIA